MEFNKKLIEGLKELEIYIDENVAEKFKKYMELLLEWNKNINLTAITKEDDIILKHFVDSLTVQRYIEKECNVIDVGTGAGFPGIPLSIINSNIEITLMDALNKRISFLNTVISELKLNNVLTVHERAEILGRNDKYREKYDIAVSRAVANLSTLVEYMIPFVKVGGLCICMKGANFEDELKQSTNAIMELGGRVKEAYNFKLPKTDYERNILIIEKVKNTKIKFPRKAGIPSKEPIR